MKKRTPTRKLAAKQSIRLGAYLAAGLGASTVASPSSDAAIVNINIGPTGFDIGGINAGGGAFSPRANFPFSGAGVLITYSSGYRYGLAGLSATGPANLSFASGRDNATPTKFTLNQSIGSSATWDQPGIFQVFRFSYYYSTYTSPDFGAGSYMGFRTAQGNYGWLAVTWTNASGQFQILSGAYESVPNVAILAGATAPAPAPIPEPGTWVAMAVFAGGAAFARWRQRRDEAA